MNVPDAAAELHEGTKHTWARILAESQGRDWGNHPLPFKIYPDLQPLWLPRELPESSVPATEVLAGHVSAPTSALDLAGLARLLFFSAGVTRFLQGVLFRAAPSAGALYPTELYVVCGPLGDLPAGVYHFEPAEFALRRLRDGDFRARLAGSAAEPAIARLPLCLVFTGIPWRTTWKYGQRGYRHLFWDAGAIVANLLAVAAAAGWGAHVLLSFVDEEVAGLVGIGEPEEYPLALVTVEAPAVAEPAGSPPLGPISPRTWPLSRSPRSDPRVSAAQRAGELASADPVTAWRDQASKLPALPATPSLAASDAGQAGAAADTIEAVILRRGSTRRFARHPIPRGALGDGDCHQTRPRRLRPTAGDAAGAFGGRARGAGADARDLSVERGRFPAASSRSGAAPHPRALPGAGPVRRFGRDRLSLRPARANPPDPGRTRLPGRPAGGRRRRGAAAAGGVRARLWRQRRHLPGRRRLGVLRHPCRTDARRRGRRPRLSGTAGQAPGPAALRWLSGALTAQGTSPPPRPLRRAG